MLKKLALIGSGMLAVLLWQAGRAYLEDNDSECPGVISTDVFVLPNDEGSIVFVAEQANQECPFVAPAVKVTFNGRDAQATYKWVERIIPPMFQGILLGLADGGACDEEGGAPEDPSTDTYGWGL